MSNTITIKPLQWSRVATSEGEHWVARPPIGEFRVIARGGNVSAFADFHDASRNLEESGFGLVGLARAWCDAAYSNNVRSMFDGDHSAIVKSMASDFPLPAAEAEAIAGVVAMITPTNSELSA